MSYNTNYRIINKKDNKVLFTSTNNSCFAQWSAVGDGDYGTIPGPWKNYNPDYKMEAFYPVKDMKISEELIVRWTKYLSSIGMPMSLSILKADDIPVESVSAPTYDATKRIYPRLVTGKDYYTWTLDFKDYTSKAHIKFALHILRYLYECTLYTVIEETYRLKEDNPKDVIWELFQLACLYTSTPNGHTVFTTYSLRNIMSIKELQSWFDRWKEAKYNNAEVQSLVASTYFRNKTMGATIPNKGDVAKKGVKLSEYKKHIEQYK